MCEDSQEYQPIEIAEDTKLAKKIAAAMQKKRWDEANTSHSMLRLFLIPISAIAAIVTIAHLILPEKIIGLLFFFALTAYAVYFVWEIKRQAEEGTSSMTDEEKQYYNEIRRSPNLCLFLNLSAVLEKWKRYADYLNRFPEPDEIQDANFRQKLQTVAEQAEEAYRAIQKAILGLQKEMIDGGDHVQIKKKLDQANDLINLEAMEQLDVQLSGRG